MEKRINVTQPFLPPLEEFIPYLESIWQSKVLTNNGSYHKLLERALCEFLGVPYISLFANGTLALLTALRSLDLTGEVITTPNSFVATTHTLEWLGLRPAFVDVDPVHGNLDPDKIEAAISSETTAILPVHVYGHPCQVERIEEIARRHGLKVVYDAAHAFGVKYKGGSVLKWGDLSVLSFHATKCFNTFEGGAVICRDEASKRRIDRLKNFGIISETEMVEPGINAKMNELQAAFGILQLKHYPHVAAARTAITYHYKRLLQGIAGLSWIDSDLEVEYNHANFPVFIDEKRFGISRDQLYEELKKENIFVRRYFYPLISNFPAYNELPSSKKELLPIANKLSEQVLCLPIYPGLGSEEVKSICQIIRWLAKSS